MKFGNHLRQNAIAHWRENYLQYDRLKRELKTRQLRHTWSEPDEAYFYQTLLDELARVGAFVHSMAGHLDSRTQFCEQLAHTVVKQPHQAQRSKQCTALLEDLDRVLFEVHQLFSFSRLNFVGFQKILKKHDKWTGQRLRQAMVVHFRDHPLDIQRLDGLLTRISHLQDLCRLGGSAISPASAEDHVKCITTKYWVHPDNITELRASLLFHIPLLQNRTDSPHESSGTAVSTVYFDNDHFDLYTGRMQRADGAEAIQFQWHGANKHAPVHVERKTYYATRLDGTTITDGFGLDASQVDVFVQGQLTPHSITHHVASDGEANDMELTATQIQATLQRRQLRPVMRCSFWRTTFERQCDGDGGSGCHISLDTDVTFIAENKDARGETLWQCKDAGQGASQDPGGPRPVYDFPYAVLETKVTIGAHQEPPAWLTRLTTSHLVHEIPRFSKYLHGSSQLFFEQLPLLPWWLNELNRDLRRGHRLYDAPMSVWPDKSDMQVCVRVDMGKPLPPTIDEKDDAAAGGIEILDCTLKRDSGPLWTDKPLPGAHGLTDVPRPNHSSSYSPRRWPGKRPGWLASSWSPRQDEAAIKTGRLDKKAKIRIEPKVFFANERTFLSWLQFCALLLTVALSLLNFGDHTSRICGGFFIIISLFLAVYAFGRYQYRAWQIRTRSLARYDDLYGPAVLCILLVIALIVNFGLRMNQPVPTMVTPFGHNTSAIDSNLTDTVAKPTHHHAKDAD